jgi:hypothetical protein
MEDGEGGVEEDEGAVRFACVLYCRSIDLLMPSGRSVLRSQAFLLGHASLS